VPYHCFIINRKSIEAICKKYDFSVSDFFTFTPTSWFFLQQNFKIPAIGEINETFNFNFSKIKQFFVSIFLRLREFLFKNKNQEDCIYCEIKLNSK